MSKSNQAGNAEQEKSERSKIEPESCTVGELRLGYSRQWDESENEDEDEDEDKKERSQRTPRAFSSCKCLFGLRESMEGKSLL